MLRWGIGLVLIALAGCGTERITANIPEGGARSSAAPAPSINLAGRWQLSSPGAGLCAMNFGAQPGAGEGTIAPEGGCPGNFFTSRKWTFENGSLVIRDHNGQPLAQLAQVPPNRFEGKSTSGMEVSLAR